MKTKERTELIELICRQIDKTAKNEREILTFLFGIIKDLCGTFLFRNPEELRKAAFYYLISDISRISTEIIENEVNDEYVHSYDDNEH